MKTKIIFAILVVLLILSITASITVFAVAELPEAVEESTPVSPVVPSGKTVDSGEYSREGAVSVKNVKLTNGDSVSLKYKGTRNNSLGTYTDIYTDSDKHEYRFSEKNTLLMKNISSAKYVDAVYEIKNKDVEIDTTEKAENAARTYAKEIFGGEIDGYSTVYTRFDERNKEYFFTFAPTYGEDGFIIGNKCHVSILADGTLVSCSMTDKDDFTDLDASTLEGVKKDWVYANCDSLIKTLYGEEMESYEISKVRVVKVGEIYKLLVLADITVDDITVAEAFYCEIN